MAPMARTDERSPLVDKTVATSETRFHDLLDALPQTVFEVDLGARFVYVNRTGLETFGYTMEELGAGLTVLDMLAPEDRERARAGLTRRMRGEVMADFEYRARRKDGTTFPALIHTVVAYQNGHPAGLQGYLIDISDRVRTETALHHRIALEQLFMRLSTRLVAKVSPQDLDARIDDALAQIGRSMGADRAYLFRLTCGGEVMDNTHEWVAEGISSERENLQHLPTATHFPLFMRELRLHGVVTVNTLDDLPAEAAPERGEFEREGIRSLVCVAMVQDGELAGFLGLDSVERERQWTKDEIALLRLVGETLMGALARKRSEEALQESERKYKALVENTATGFVIVDQRGLVLDANAEYVRATGHGSLDEILGHSVLEWTSPAHQERNAEAVRVCVENGQLSDLQVDYCHTDGTVVPVLINASVSEIDGKRRVLALVHDISDRKRLEDELLRSEKLRSVGVLAGGIAHDFNNILTAILGNITLMQTVLAGGEQGREHLDEIAKATQRARELTRQLLTFSRGGEPVRRPFAPEGIVRESVALALRGRASACEVRMSADLPSIYGDEGQIGQVIRNLVINASQAMDDGGVITLSAEKRTVKAAEVPSLAAGDYLALSVVDHGSGIPEEIRSRIFDPYFTTKREGRGLGLAVCHSIMAGHGGTITLVSRVGDGAIFTMYLPVSVDGTPIPAVRTTSITRGHGRVLIMDDEDVVRRVASKIVLALGYEVEAAIDGRDAIEKWQRAHEQGSPFDVVIMDLTVPGGVGGREAIRELLALDPKAKAIVSSGYSDNPVMANYREYGFCDVLGKPYSVADVSRTLSSVLSPARRPSI
jgi:PAS domain S-box-containing protein